MPLPTETGPYTYADILEMKTDASVELIHGHLYLRSGERAGLIDGNLYVMHEDARMWHIDSECYMMSQMSVQHQIISGELFSQLHALLSGKKGRVLYAPFAVSLFDKAGDKPKDIKTVVEPDLALILDPEKIADGVNCKGAPDLIIEILSPSSQNLDLQIKYRLYQKAGVQEYWIVYPDAKAIMVHTLYEDGNYYGGIPYTRAVPVRVLGDCAIDLNPVFEGM